MAVRGTVWYNYSIVLSGVAGVGKTSIFNHVKGKAKTDGKVVEIGTLEGGIDCCIYTTTINEINFKIALYDTGGLERFASLTSNYYHRCHAVILVYLVDPDKLNTLTCLNTCIESALSYNKSPDTLVFTLWGNDFIKERMIEKDPSEQVQLFLEANAIPQSLHFVVSPSDDRLMVALEQVILAIHAKNRPKTDSTLLRPGVLVIADSLESSEDFKNTGIIIGTAEIQENKKERKKCCK